MKKIIWILVTCFAITIKIGAGADEAEQTETASPIQELSSVTDTNIRDTLIIAACHQTPELRFKEDSSLEKLLRWLQVDVIAFQNRLDQDNTKLGIYMKASGKDPQGKAPQDVGHVLFYTLNEQQEKEAYKYSQHFLYGKITWQRDREF